MGAERLYSTAQACREALARRRAALSCMRRWKWSRSGVSGSLRPPVECRPPGSSGHGLLQAGVLECVPFPSLGRICAPPKEQRRRCRHGRREYSEFASPGGTRVSAVPRRLELSCSLPARALPSMGLANSARSEIRCDHRKGREETQHTRPVCPLLCLLWIPTLPVPLVSQTSKLSWQRRRKIPQHCFCFLLTASQGINSS